MGEGHSWGRPAMIYRPANTHEIMQYNGVRYVAYGQI